MHVPTTWYRATASVEDSRGRSFPISAWGWGDAERQARKVAEERLGRMSERVRRGEPFPDSYEYATRPIREEILETIDAESGRDAAAIITRNRYGARVLNTDGMLFLDVDLPRERVASRLLQFFRPRTASVAERTLEKLRNTLDEYRRATFRIYRTAAGFRAIAVDKQFDPTGEDTRKLMEATGTDPYYMRLCVAQQSFRARLTPKPWRCGCRVPPGRYPRTVDEADAFADWKRDYESRIGAYATCEYVDTVGRGRPTRSIGNLLSIHDRATQCDARLPLA